jgi:hypothetical protein
MENREATVEQIYFFREHGWLVVENAVEPAEIDEVAARMEVSLRKKHKLAYDWAWEKGKSKRDAGGGTRTRMGFSPQRILSSLA